MSEAAPTVPVTEVPEGAVVLDVREDDEWEAGHAPGAVHVPLGDLPARHGELPAEEDLYVVCRSGGRAARAAAWLVEGGYDAVVVDGGMGAWAQAGRPMEASGGGVPRVL
jgi:rhodanese-related sulfurtransferase